MTGCLIFDLSLLYGSLIVVKLVNGSGGLLSNSVYSSIDSSNEGSDEEAWISGVDNTFVTSASWINSISVLFSISCESECDKHAADSILLFSINIHK